MNARVVLPRLIRLLGLPGAIAWAFLNRDRPDPGTQEASGVLAAMGIGNDRAIGALRLSVGVSITEKEIRNAARALTRACAPA